MSLRLPSAKLYTVERDASVQELRNNERLAIPVASASCPELHVIRSSFLPAAERPTSHHIYFELHNVLMYQMQKEIRATENVQML